MFKAVVCDLFGTLVDMYPFHEDGCIREIAASLDVPASEFSGPWLESYAAREAGRYASIADCLSFIGRRLASPTTTGMTFYVQELRNGKGRGFRASAVYFNS